jgi:hypothetical protein
MNPNGLAFNPQSEIHNPQLKNPRLAKIAHRGYHCEESAR